MGVCARCHRDAPEGALFCSFCGSGIKPAGAGDESDALVGATISGKYFVQQLLGRGGMGDVYKATHLTLDRPVVVKLLKRSFLSDDSLVQRFHREARAASRLNHPNSITIIDFGQTEDGTLFMAMEYLSGRTLERVIAEDWPLREARVVRIGAQILGALAEAHALGIIHRDLKPTNVMLESRRDEPDFVKVLDFGIAKLNESGAGAAPLTQAGLVCGTPGYMSPEQVRGEELDARSDLYSAGVVLYEMLTGLQPFEADTPMGLLTKHLVEEPPPLAVRRSGAAVSPALESLVMRALAKDKDARPASADEMRAELLACSIRQESAPYLEAAPAAPATVFFAPTRLSGSPPRGTPASARTPPPPAHPPARMIPAPARSPPAPRTPVSTAPVPRTPAPKPVAPRTPSPKAVTPRPAPPPAHPAGPDEAQGQVGETSPEPAVVPARRRNLPLLAAGGAGIALVASLLVWGMARPPSSQPPPQVVPAPPPVPQPTPGPAPQPQPAPQPFPAPAPQPDPAPEPAPPTPDPQPAPKPPPVVARICRAARGELNAVKIPPASSGEGVLAIDATPWAEVSVDGKDIGETPREMRCGAGTYHVKLTHPQFGTREENVAVPAGKRRIWSATFAP